jgi:hypothetical protein
MRNSPKRISEKRASLEELAELETKKLTRFEVVGFCAGSLGRSASRWWGRHQEQSNDVIVEA